MANVLVPATRSLWSLLAQKTAAQDADTPQDLNVPFSPLLSEGIKVDDSTNQPMIPKSMSVAVKRPLGYARPAKPEETVESLLSRLGEASDQALHEQNQGIDKLEGQLGELKSQALPESLWGKIGHANLRPLLAIADSVSNTNMAGNYQAPENLTDRQKTIMQLEDAIQRRRGEVSKEQLSALKDKINFYLKDKDDPMKELMAMTRINYMNALANNTGNRIDDRIETDVQKLSDKVSNIQDLQNSLHSLESTLGFKLDDYSENKGAVNGKKVKLPGAAVPGLGRVTFYDKDARNLQSKFARIFNVELKDRSGAAVTSPEMARMKEEFNAGRFNTEDELLTAVKAYKNAVTQELKNREAAYRGVVKDRYRSRGGQLSDDFDGRNVKAQRKDWGGKTYELQGDQWVEVKK